MRSLIAIFIALLAVLSTATCEQTMKNVKPGPITIDLGNGYTAAFTLGTSERAYDIVVDTASANDILKNTYYGFQVYPTGSDEDLVRVLMYVYSDPQPWPAPKASRQDQSFTGVLGDRVIEPQTIDGSVGYVGYDWPINNPATDIEEANGAFFHYFPGARKTLDGIETYVDITGETLGLDTFPRSSPVFESLLDTLNIQGPAIA